MTKIKICLLSIALFSVNASYAAGPSKEWSDSWEFSTPSSRSIQLQQADLIERERADYYKGLSTNTYNIGTINNINGISTGTYTTSTYNNTTTGDNNSVNMITASDNSGDTSSKISIK